MDKDEFKRRLRQLIREELERTDLEALVYGALASIDLQALVKETLHDQFYMTSSTSPCNSDVLH